MSRSYLANFSSILLLPFLLFGSPEEILHSLSLEEKVGQLFVAPFCPLRGDDHREDWLQLLGEMHIGNVLLKASDPTHQIDGLNWLQEQSPIPLLVTADAEWGLAMNMSGTIAFPKNELLGATEDLSFLEEFGCEVAREAKLVGIQMNLAPVLDVNSNPSNPIIGPRSFGSDPHRVAECGAAVIAGFKKGGLLSCAKHFPGHGDTSVDSHLDLPVIAKNFAQLEQTELVPFISAIAHRIDAIMTAHILIPSLDSTTPATLSYPILTTLLREQLGYSGLIITDALNMAALTKLYAPDAIAFQAHLAGADLLLYGIHISEKVDELLRKTIPLAYQTLLNAYEVGALDVAKLDESVLRILRAKEKAGLFQQRPRLSQNPDLNTTEALELLTKILNRRQANY